MSLFSLTNNTKSTEKGPSLFDQCHKNREILLNNYSGYIKELKQTNIVKWRVLDGMHTSKSENIRALNKKPMIVQD